MSGKHGYTAEQRAAAITLVRQLRAAEPQRRNGAIATAARRLGIGANTLGQWCRQHDLTHTTTSTPVPPSLRRRDVAALASLLTCGLCGMPMSYQCTQTGVPVYRCTHPCLRRGPILAARIDQVIGQMILHTIPWTYRTHNQITTDGAAWHASQILTRITVGTRPTDLHVHWRTPPSRSHPATTTRHASRTTTPAPRP